MFLQELEDIIFPNEKFTFLVGAGISIEPPSCLKSAVDIVKILVKLCALENEVSKILSLNSLRYETVVEFIQKYFDPDLKIMDFFDKFTQPNIHHYFLAHAINKGHHVITTNFDYLIEFALLDIIKEKKNIVPIITHMDFINYADPDNLVKENKFPIYKIHGSKRNLITNEDTGASLVTTISALGRDRDEKTFAIESFKKPAMVNLLENRTLIVMGYSGSDDFDISPTLKELQNISKLIWLNHTSEDIPGIVSFKPLSGSKTGLIGEKTLLLEQLADNAAKLHHTLKIFKIDVNTASLVRKNLWDLLLNDFDQPKFTEKFPIEFDYEKWFYEALKPFDEFKKRLFTWELYYRLAQPDEALRIGEIGLKVAEEQGDFNAQSSFLNNNGLIYLDKGDPKKALEYFERASELGDFKGSSMTLNNIAMVYKSQRDYQNALNWLKKALEEAENSPNNLDKIIILNNIGLTAYSEGEYQYALEHYEIALNLNQKLGDLGIKSRLLSNIGSVYFSNKDYEKALDKFQEALKISEELGDLNGINVRLNNIATIYLEQGKRKLALSIYEKALENAEILGDLAKKAIYLTNMAIVYSELDSKEKAVKLLDEALPLDKSLRNMERVLFSIKKAGAFYKDIGEYQNALIRYEEALDYYEKAKDLGGVSGTYNDMAMVYYNQGKLSKAIETLEKAIDIATQGGFSQSPEVQDFTYGLNMLKQKQQNVMDFENIMNNWEVNQLSGVAVQVNKQKLDDIVRDVNTNPYILEKFLWEIDKGKHYLEKILEMFQNEINQESVLITKGFLFAFLNRYDEAMNYFEKALSINSTSINAIVGIALCKINKKDLEQGLNLLKKFEYFGNYLIDYLLSLVYLRRMDFENSENYLKRVIENKPNFFPALNTLGTIYYHRNDFDKACNYWQEVLNFEPSYLKAYSNLGLIYYNQKNYIEAEIIYKKLLELDINDSFTLNMLARIYFDSKQTDKGEWILKRMLILDPKNKSALQNLAGIYYNAGNYHKAEIYYKKALELDPDDLNNLEFLKNSYRGMGKTERVKEIQEKIDKLTT